MPTRLLLPALLLLTSLAKPQAKPGADLWLSTPDRVSLVAHQPQPLPFGNPTSVPLTIAVDDGTRYQQMDGFGFALTGGSAQLLMRMSPTARAAILHELFDTTGNGIGTSYLRVSIGVSDMNERVFTYDDMPPGQTDPQLTHFALGPDLQDVVPILKQILAINPRVAILGSPWSAPSWMKSNNLPKGGSLLPEFYPAYAQYFVRYLQAMSAQGITLKAITMQNEPLNPKNTPSLVMSAREEASFLASALGPALRKAGLATDVILYDHNCDRPDYPLDILADPAAAPFAKGSGFHLYGGTVDAMTKVHEAHPDKDLYFTEQMVVDKLGDTTFGLAQPISRIVIGATRNWSRNVLLWNLAADPSFGPHTSDGGCPVCQGAITLDGDTVTRNLAFYTIAHIARFVPPGSVRIDSTATPDLPNVAFLTPEHGIVLLAANTSSSTQAFAVTFHSRAFTATLAPGAVGTFTWH